MDVSKTRETVDDTSELLADHLLTKFDLARIETSDSANLEAATNLGWQLAVGGTQDDVNELGRGGNLRDILPSVGKVQLSISILCAKLLSGAENAYWVFMVGRWGERCAGSKRKSCQREKERG